MDFETLQLIYSIYKPYVADAHALIDTPLINFLRFFVKFWKKYG